MINYQNRMILPSFNQLMQYREIIAVCSEILTKHTNAPCGQDVEFLNVKHKKNLICPRILQRFQY